MLALRNITEGGLTGPDTPQHAMTGIFIADFLRDLVFLKSFQEMWNYTWTYYAHYPAVALLHWPPLFHLIEGVYVLFASISEAALRALIFAFFALGALYYYVLMVHLSNANLAFLSSLLFITSPLVLTFSRMVSLEIPSMAVCLMAIYFFNHYTRTYRIRDGLYASIFTILALLTKQNAFFLGLFYLLYFLSGIFDRTDTRNVNYKQLCFLVGIIAIFSLPYYAVSFYLHGGTILKDISQGTVYQNPYLSWGNYIYYFLSLKNQLSLTCILLLIIFIVLSLTRRIKVTHPARFLLLWALSCYLTFTLVAQKDARYIIYWVPALTGLAAVGALELARLLSQRWKMEAQKGETIIIAVIILIAAAQGIASKPPITGGYDEIARHILATIPAQKSEILFYDGKDHGFLTYALRKNDPERRTFLFRSSKYLYATNIFSDYETWNVRPGKNEIMEFFKKYGIRYVILSFTTESHIPAVQLLRELVKVEENFVLVKRFSVVNWLYGSGEVALYAYKGAGPLAPGTELEIPMPTLGKTIKIRLH